MAPPINDKKVKNRRRKKRRTEDFSSDSDSDSSSSSSNDEAPTEAQEEPTQPASQPAKSIDINDVDVDSENEEAETQAQNEPLSKEVSDKVKSIKFTSLENQSSAEAQQTLNKDKQQLENEYLGLMATSFANDIDELRKKPDFTDKSVVMLAKALQSGSNMFDEDSLDALLKK
ncbi:hypothetical protein FT663_03376 [Candidozyma haemuli var. vulneris]|uniref:Ribosome assembly protein 3 n=1 Tax=Candidozyma haemuli TaxID=45357 RepID=A0A2V1APG1_9ASCO|nr:hypothetical protein CXQ85_001737 [[Candida] haemuloni]KAF3989838.1 hypothetical protein FT662_02618 [[Candida] haemuloni var. vulneris]KAF3989998.1 hypothetical protein FT663_03376 [[Candida] haemuloni var. vulneris]PVH19960.1 hypothetical protein CXQ85_001737 [[Candida] haemuloni]